MIIKKQLGVDVVTAAKQRIIEVFNNNIPVLLSFSGGKDSIVLAELVYQLAVTGRIDKNLIEVIFVDEEAIYDEVIEVVKRWRTKFMMAGIKFSWYAMEIRHFNALNSLSDEENFICWDRFKKDVWIRPKPDFAITDHPLFIPRKDTYQSFFTRLNQQTGTISLIGNRTAESVQRLTNIAKQTSAYASGVRAFPIYDMTDKDVWKYIREHRLDIPNVYENLYRVGTSIGQLRMSSFFSIDTVRSLTKMDEIYPDLMKRISKREPNAYLVAMYWDSAMFRRSTRKRREIEKETITVDYRNEVFRFINNPHLLDSEDKRKLAQSFKQLIVRHGTLWDERAYKQAHDIIVAGDPKRRSYRAFITNLFTRGGGGFKRNDRLR